MPSALLKLAGTVFLFLFLFYPFKHFFSIPLSIFPHLFLFFPIFSSAMFVLSLCLLQPVSTIFQALPLLPSRALLALRWELQHTSVALAFMFGNSLLALPPRGHPLISWFWELGGGFSPRSHGTVISRETDLGKLPLTGHDTDSGLKHASTCCDKESYLPPRRFGLRDKLLDWHTSRSL